MLLACSLLPPLVFAADLNVDHPFPAFFIFGDSIVDVGNNNYITSVARANSLPFGIDFPQGPTGRFTNGRTVLDVIAELIHLPYPPPYLAPTTKGNALLQGVSFASAAAGILRATGFNFVGRVDFDTQIMWFENTIQELQQLLGESEAQKLIEKSLFTTVFGANDYVNNFLLSYAPSNKMYTAAQFEALLIQTTASQLTQLYKLGARMIAVSSLPPLGCIPSQLVRQKSVNGECSDYVNNMSASYNSALEALLPQLNSQLPGAMFLYADAFNPVLKLCVNPNENGFEFGTTGCCGAGKYNGQTLCFPFLKPCANRSSYVFFDAYHPTEHANVILGNSFYSGLEAIFA